MNAILNKDYDLIVDNLLIKITEKIKNMWYKKKIELSEEEKEILETIEIMCENPKSEVLIDPFTMDYYITNREQHYDIILTSSYIHLTNTITNHSASYRGSFIDLCKNAAKKRAMQDRLKVKNAMLDRRKEMLLGMKSKLK